MCFVLFSHYKGEVTQDLQRSQRNRKTDRDPPSKMNPKCSVCPHSFTVTLCIGCLLLQPPQNLMVSKNHCLIILLGFMGQLG